MTCNFFLLTPVICTIYFKNKKYGWIAVCLLFITSWATTFGISYQNGYLVTNFDIQPASQDLKLYKAPWVRIQAYLVGIILAFVLLEKGTTHKVELHKRYVWYSGAGLLIVGILSLHAFFNLYVITNPLFNSFFLSFMRTVWTAGLAIQCYFMFIGYLPWMSAFFGSSLWKPLSQLTYGVYLVHYIVLWYGQYSSVQYQAFAIFDILNDTFALTTWAYLLSIITFLFIEKPFDNLQRRLLSKEERR